MFIGESGGPNKSHGSDSIVLIQVGASITGNMARCQLSPLKRILYTGTWMSMLLTVQYH